MSEQELRDALQFDAIPALLIFAEDNAGVRATIAKLRRVLATPPASAEREHEPGESHDYGPPTCRVCGVEGMLNLSIEPQRSE